MEKASFFEKMNLLKENPQVLEHLQKLEKEVSQLTEKEPEDKKKSFYKALETIIDLKMNVEEVNQKFENIFEVFFAMASGDFSRRLEVSNKRNIFTLLATNLNMVNQELSTRVVKNHFLEETLELLDDMVLITDAGGTIIFANRASGLFLNQTHENIIKLRVANIFKTKTQFGTDNETWEDAGIHDYEVVITPYNAPEYTVLLQIKQLKDTYGTDGYLYRLSKISA